MANMNGRRGMGKAAILCVGAILAGTAGAHAQAPVKTKLKKILVLDKSQGGANGHLESRRDLNAALKALGTEKGFTVTIIGQDDPASKISSEFSVTSLATYQAVLFSNNDGVHAQLDATDKANFEAYVKNGGGFLPIHAASAFISNWAWVTNAMVEGFYGPHGSNQPTANVNHDPEGNKDATETKGIFKGLTAPLAFLDEYYSFRASPRGKTGVTILLTVDESTFSKTVNGPMGTDHPVVWSKTEGKGRVVHLSMGHSWSTNNVYAAKNAYLKNFLYGSLRYAAGDFIGCTNNTFKEYNPDATKSDPAACLVPVTTMLRPDGKDAQPLISREAGKQLIRVDLRDAGTHTVTMLDIAGRLVQSKQGKGPASYSLAVPSQSGIYTVLAKSGGKSTRYRVTVL